MNLLDDPKQLLSALVSVPSVSGAEAELADCVESWTKSAGLCCERAGTSVIVRVGPQRSHRARLLFNSHLDTVPVGNGWESDAFDGTWRDGQLCARGANDAKASVAAMLTAAHALKDQDLPGELIIALTVQEETSNAGMAEVLNQIGKPAAAVTGEPTGLEVVRAQSGLVVLEARWSGKSCHAAHVARVSHTSALLAAAKATGALPAFLVFDFEHDLLGNSTIAPTVLTAGERHNVVPDSALLVLDARIAPPLDAEACLALVQEALPDAELSVRSRRLGPVETAADHPLVLSALKSANKRTAIGSSTLSDMALLGDVPAVKCGPGQTQRSHTPNEFVLLEELLEGARFYTSLAPRALEALTGQEVSP